MDTFKVKIFVTNNKIKSYISPSLKEKIKINYKIKNNTIFLYIIVNKNVKIEKKVHFCVKISENITQKIYSKIILKENSELNILSHCIGTEKYLDFKHIMKGIIILNKNSKLTIEEYHLQGPKATVNRDIKILLKDNSSYIEKFKTLKREVGKLILNLNSILLNNASLNIDIRVVSSNFDKIKIKEKVILKGENSSAHLITKGFAEGNSNVNFDFYMIGAGKNSKGHIECHEIIKDKANIISKPFIKIKNSQSRITHEASLGKIEKEKIIYLMAKGLSEEEAIKILINGFLR